MARLGAFLCLDEAIYPEHSLDLVLAKLLKDFSLPAGLAGVIKHSLQVHKNGSAKNYQLFYLIII